MRMRHLVSAVCAAMCCLPAGGQSAEVALTRNADLRYAATSAVAARRQSLDVYTPRGAKAAPVVVYVHGGFWKAGDKRGVGRLPQFFGQAGYVFVSVNYRLAPAAKHPALMSELGTKGDPVGPAVLGFLRTVGGRKDDDLGTDRVLALKGDAAERAARDIEAYQARILMRQFDRDRDGKARRGEVPPRFSPQFSQMDRDGDGAIVEAELREHYRGRLAKPASAGRPVFTNLTFTKDYSPGTRDRNGRPRGGVECNHIESHKGKLFATVSTWKQRGWDRGRATGPQVLVKHQHDGPWGVDHAFGPTYARAECLRSVTFTTDKTGRKLKEPVTVLLASASSFRKRIGVWSRDDSTGGWTLMPLAAADTAWKTEVRTLIDHVDRVTGVHHVFVPCNQGTIYRGAYDPSAAGRVAWQKRPELDHRETMPGGQRMPAAAVANGVLHVSMQIDPAASGRGGVFRRIDGPEPRWDHVYEWEHRGGPRERRIKHKQDRQMRGLTAVPDPARPGRELLVGTRTFTGEVLKLDPADGYKVQVEFDSKKYFQRAFGSDRARVFQIGPNGLTPVAHPDSDAQSHIFGLWAYHPDGADTPKGHSSWYLVRSADGTYAHGRVWSPQDPVPNRGVRGGLRTTRAVCPSPFPQDGGRVLYFGGFDSGLSTAREEFGYTAWIYRAEIPKKGNR